MKKGKIKKKAVKKRVVKKISKIKPKKVKFKMVKIKKSKSLASKIKNKLIKKKIFKTKLQKIKKVKVKKIKLKKTKKSVVKIKNKKKRFIWFTVGTAVLAGLLLLNLLFAVVKAPVNSDLSSSEGLASLKGLSSEKWCNSADLNNDGSVDAIDLYLARQNNLGTDIKTLYLVSVNLGRTDCKG